MPQIPNDGELLELLYAAVGEPGRWTDFLGAISKRLEAPGVALICHCPSRKEFEVNVNVGLPADSLTPYAKYYGSVDVWAPGVRKMPEGAVQLGTDVCSPAEFRESEFYKAFLKKYRPFFYQCGVVLENNQHTFGNITCLREPGQRNFTQEDLQFLSRLSGHLRHAFRLHRRLLNSHQALKQTMSIVGRFDAGLVLGTAERKICSFNDVAEQILDAGNFFGRESNRLVCKDKSKALQFNRFVQTACNPLLNTVSGGTLTLHSGKNRLHVSVFPHLGNQSLVAPRPIAAVVLSDPKTQPKSREESLKTLFGLTPAEVAVAMLVAEGREPREIARILGTKWDTVRDHLKKIYGKTKANRQAKLVSLIARLPGDTSIESPHLGDVERNLRIHNRSTEWM